MSSSSPEEESPELLTRVTREERLLLSFDFYSRQGAPTRGAVVLRLEGFGIVTIVGCDPEAACVGDIAIEIVHSGFHTRAKVWVKARNGPSGWVSTSRMQHQYFFTSYLASSDAIVGRRGA
jgi:fermentation-respiration switch protein FrsA (DUF1100 family)